MFSVAVFERLSDGRRFVIANTHPAPRNEPEKYARNMADLTAFAADVVEKYADLPVIIAGDFNTDPTASRFEQEQTFPVLEQAGFVNCFAGLPLEKRGTHPGGKTYPDITFDYVLHRGFAQANEPVLSSAVPLSDHRMVWLRLR